MSSATTYLSSMSAALVVGGATMWNCISETRAITNIKANANVYSIIGALLSSSALLSYSLGQVKVGITRQLGKPVYQSDINTKDVSPDGNQVIGRRLGLLERWYIAHSRSGAHTGFILATDIEPQNGSKASPTIHDIKEILLRVCIKYPWLRTKVHRDGVTSAVDSRTNLAPASPSQQNGQQPLWGDDLYVRVSKAVSHAGSFVSVRQVCVDGNVQQAEKQYQEVVREVLEEEGRTEWHDEDPTQNLWRVTMVTFKADDTHNDANRNYARFTLVLAFHHLICDGLGAVDVTRSIVDTANSYYGGKLPAAISQEGAVVNMETISECMLPAPMEDMMDTSPTLSYLLKPLLLDCFPFLTKYLQPPHWQGNPTHTEISADIKKTRSTSIRRAKLITDTQPFYEKCKAQKVTANSVLIATLSRAVADVIIEGSNERQHKQPYLVTTGSTNTGIRFQCTVAADERRRRADRVRPTDLGTYVTAPDFYLEIEERAKSSVIHLAKKFHSKLKESLKMSAMNMGLVKFISEDWIAFSNRRKLDRPNGSSESLDISNLGMIKWNINNEEGGEDLPLAAWKVTDMWFAQGRQGFGAALAVNLICTDRSGLNTVLSAFPETVSTDMMDTIIQRWKEEIIQFLK